MTRLEHCTPQRHPTQTRPHFSPARFLVSILLIACFAWLMATPSTAMAIGLTTRVSVASDATQADNASFGASLSAEGRYIVFGSEAGNLIVNDGNAYADIFIHDRTAFTTHRVSVASDGTPADAPSYGPAISADGRFIAFWSSAGNLVANDTNGTADVFVRDRLTNVTSRVSVATGGIEANGPSAGAIDGGRPVLTADGRYVIFASGATNLVANDTNQAWDVFMHDRQTGVTTRVSVSSSNGEGNDHSGAPSVSLDGRYIVFASLASNLITNDINSVTDIFMRDTLTGTTTRMSIATDGTESDGHSGQPSLSGDGRYLAFASDATNLTANDENGLADVFIRDRNTGITSRVSVSTTGGDGNGDSAGPSLSSDGRYVAFTSQASNLVALDTNDVADVFIRDLQLSLTQRASIASDGAEASGPSGEASLSANGHILGFQSYAPDLVAGDTNACVPFINGRCPDIFVRERTDSTGERIQGQIQLQGRGNYSGVSVLLMGPSTTATITDGGGLFVFSNILPGEYKLQARRNGWLCSEYFVTVGMGQTVNIPINRLIAGDINGDGRINIFDLVFVAAFYGENAMLQPVADLDGDGFINLADLILVGVNFGDDCPTPWGTLTAQGQASVAAAKTAPRVSLTPRPTGKDGLTVVDVWADHVDGAHGFELAIQTDDKRVTLVGSTPFAIDPTHTDRYTVRNRLIQDQAELAGVVLGRQPLQGRVHLGSLTVRGDASGLRLSHTRWFNSAGQPF